MKLDRRLDEDYLPMPSTASVGAASGFVSPLPESLAGMSAEVDGQPTPIENGSLRFQKLPIAV